jgi:hypothetical protein
MTRAELARQPCSRGGAHRLTQPILWIGASCWRCHQTWEGTALAPTWPMLPLGAPNADTSARPPHLRED